VDAAEPPRIVFETPEACSPADRAEQALRKALQPALAPAPGWVVTLRIDRTTGHGLRAEGEIDDATGAPVAHRTLGGTAGECASLARAAGVWASLVLDAELRRANQAATDRQPEGGPTGPEATPGAGATATAEAEPATQWPAPAPPEKPSPEHDWYLHHDEGRTLEVGAGTFLMTGTGGGALAGPTVFAVLEGSHGLFFRPAIAFGESLTDLPPSDVKSSTWSAARFDTCLRLPGLYTLHHGMQLDACGGAEIGFTYLDARDRSTLPYVDLGPSMDLRGELGSRLSAALRFVTGVNLVRESFVDLNGNTQQPPVLEARLELAFSWDFR
jgi:hypothetical protein